ncbi:MAG: type I-U CRISPR-associated helicase/endonuclease Cas3 [Gammaproteobacteria bacterium]|nr:type I-U CRISPR-associated helicase/endonuclease Cas3 [Gammaproteobacteria bacterium]
MNVPLPSFNDFYQALNDRAPFPWQTRLAQYVERTESWPSEIGIPTGLGKTACLEIAIWWLASQADRKPESRTAPTRIWWVVNRRLLVDSTAQHAKKIADTLHDTSNSQLTQARSVVIGQIADRLRSLWVNPTVRPLDVISLRGGLTSRSPTDPARPTVILCTLPMYGSRFLFRGYGVHGSRLSVDAGMAGTDSLVLLDEAHLVSHLKKIVADAHACFTNAKPWFNSKRTLPLVVSLTATGNPDGGDRFDLDDEDRAHPKVRKRLEAQKPIQLVVAKGDLAGRLAEALLGLLKKSKSPSSFLVFCNTPRTARATFEIINKKIPNDHILLSTGLVRESEANRIRDQILDPDTGMSATRSPDKARSRHIVVVSTQTLEVGADIDADFLVTEACGVRALTQRLGRLNRLGRSVNSRAVYVHTPPTRTIQKGNTNQGTWPVYENEPLTVLNRLKGHNESGKSTIDLTSKTITSVLGPPTDTPNRAPEVLPALLYEWTKTTTPPEGEAPVEPYFSGISSTTNTVTVIWRAYTPPPQERLWPRWNDREAIDVPLVEARQALEGKHFRRLKNDGLIDEIVNSSELRPGDHIIVAVDAGLMDEFGWNPDSNTTVQDRSLELSGLPLDADAIKRLCGRNLSEQVDSVLEVNDTSQNSASNDIQESISEILVKLATCKSPLGWESSTWPDFVQSIEPLIKKPRQEVARLSVSSPRTEPRDDEFDEFCLTEAATSLVQHGEDVSLRVKHVGQKLGLPSELLDVVEFAGLLHDIGKADSRFQTWLDPKGTADRLLAKSKIARHDWQTYRKFSRWPRGGRHEDLSARLVRAWLDRNLDWGSAIQRDLLIHLVISHHGKGRPLVPPVTDVYGGLVSFEIRGDFVEVNANMTMTDWQQPSRFQRLQTHFGPWALALLEALLIRSDHAISAGVDRLDQDI